VQLRVWSAFALYVGSYLPLSLILFAQDLDFEAIRAGHCTPTAWKTLSCQSPLLHPAWSLTAVAASCVCLVLTLSTLRAARAAQRVEIKEAKHVPADLINYVIPYVLSFTGIDFDSPAKLLGFGVFFLWVFWITYRSGQIIMNPMLVVFGWRLYEIKYRYLQGDRDFTRRVLADSEIEPNTTYRQADLQDVMIIRHTDQEN
jgi:hypothetical protein